MGIGFVGVSEGPQSDHLAVSPVPPLNNGMIPPGQRRNPRRVGEEGLTELTRITEEEGNGAVVGAADIRRVLLALSERVLPGRVALEMTGCSPL